MTERVLMIEDDESLSAMVIEYLASMGLKGEASARADTGLAALREGEYDALILDVMLPDADGFDVCRAVRRDSDIPILMLTARGDEMDRIIGLEIGADDYLPKPFNPRELVARLRAILRRRTQPKATASKLRFAELEIDLDAREVRKQGDRCDLTGYQFDLLAALARSPGRVMSRDTLMSQVKGESLEAFDRSIDVHISRIRAVIEADPRHPRHVLTVRGVGYVFARNDARSD